MLSMTLAFILVLALVTLRRRADINRAAFAPDEVAVQGQQVVTQQAHVGAVVAHLVPAAEATLPEVPGPPSSSSAASARPDRSGSRAGKAFPSGAGERRWRP